MGMALRGFGIALLFVLLGAGHSWAEIRREETPAYSAFLQKRHGPVMMLLPGAGIAPVRYMGLVTRLMEARPDLSIFVPKFTADYVNPLEVGARLTTVLKRLETLGWDQPASSLFVAGHSLGGIFAHDLVTQHNLAGLILLASYLPKSVIGASPYTYATYPKPILGIGAELDGRIKLLRQAQEYWAYEDWTQGHKGDYSHFYAILPGLNHMSIADGHYIKGDLKAEYPMEEGHRRIAAVIALFIAHVRDHRDSDDDLRALGDYTAKTTEILSPLRFAQGRTKDVCGDAQKMLGSWTRDRGDTPRLRTREHQFFPAFVADKAKVNRTEEGPELYVPYYVETPPNPADLSGNEWGGPVTVACKMLSRDSLISEGLASESAPALDCAALIQRIMDQALESLAPDQRARFDEVGPVVRHRVVAATTGLGWVSTHFKISRVGSSREWIMEIPGLRTSLETVPRQFAGAHYCKLIAPERAVQWLTLDALVP